MYKKIVLKGDDFTFQIKPNEALNDWFDGTVYLTSTVMGDNFLLQTNVYCPFDDWLRLCDWMEKHIQKLKDNVDSITLTNDETWTPFDTTLNFTLLAGTVEYQDKDFNGGFGVRIMIKVFAKDSATYVHSGLEGEVEVHEALTFCKTLREYVNSQNQVAAPA